MVCYNSFCEHKAGLLALVGPASRRSCSRGASTEGKYSEIYHLPVTNMGAELLQYLGTIPPLGLIPDSRATGMITSLLSLISSMIVRLDLNEYGMHAGVGPVQADFMSIFISPFSAT